MVLLAQCWVCGSILVIQGPAADNVRWKHGMQDDEGGPVLIIGCSADCVCAQTPDLCEA